MPNPDGTPTQAELALQLAGINTAIASGTTRVSYGDKSVEYRDLNELIRVRDMISRQLGVVVPARRSVAAFSGGFY